MPSNWRHSRRIMLSPSPSCSMEMDSTSRQLAQTEQFSNIGVTHILADCRRCSTSTRKRELTIQQRRANDFHAVPLEATGVIDFGIRLPSFLEETLNLGCGCEGE